MKNNKESNKEYDNSEENINISIDFGLGKLFGGLKNILDVVSDLSGEVKKEGKFSDSEGKIKGVYGFSVKSMGNTHSIEQFGNRVKKDDNNEKVIIDKVREPIVDVFDEGEFYTIVTEMPGIEENNIIISISGDIVQISAKSSGREYEKEILLKSKVCDKPEKSSYTNGIFELQLKKSAK